MSKRLIYAEDAIDALKQLRKNISEDYTVLDPLVMAGCGYIGDCIGELECLPSAQLEDICSECDAWNVYKNYAQPQWIPTSKTETIPDHEVLCCDRYENQMIGYLINDHGEWICESDSEVMYDTVAWMEKPEPYKGGTVMSDIVGKIGVVLMLIGFALAMIGLLTIFVGFALEDLL